MEGIAMKKSSVIAIALSTILGLGSVIPASAGVPLPKTEISRTSDVTTVAQHRRKIWRKGQWRGHNGHRGYRSGYRRHSDGFWYPLAIFGTGVFIGSQIQRGAPSHRNWCANRYRSYRAYDNSYQPNYGPRRLCRSPY